MEIAQDGKVKELEQEFYVIENLTEKMIIGTDFLAKHCVNIDYVEDGLAIEIPTTEGKRHDENDNQRNGEKENMRRESEETYATNTMREI